MLTMPRSARAAENSSRLMWPACRLPMVGHRGTAAARALHEVAHEARLAPGGNIEHVVEHQDLPVGVRARADADDRHVHALGDLAAERRWNTFEQQHVGTRRLQGLRISDHPRGVLLLTPLNAKPAGLVHRLWLEAEVRAHRDVVPGEVFDDFKLRAASFELDHPG